MNLTISCLCISHLFSSPALSRSNAKHINLDKSTILRSYSHFFYNIPILCIDNSVFSNFTSSAIFYSSHLPENLIIDYNQTYNSRPENQPMLLNNITIRNARFLHCKSQGNGGALCHLSFEHWGSIIAHDSIFVDCSASPNSELYHQYGSGGAIFFLGNYSRFSNIYAYKCRAEEDGQFIYLEHLNSNPMEFNMEFTTISKCSEISYPGGYYAAFIKDAEMKISNVNISNCDVKYKYSAMMLTGKHKKNMKNSIFDSNFGHSLIWFNRGEEKKTDIQNTCFTKNGNHEKNRQIALIRFSSEVNFHNCLFLKNFGETFSRIGVDPLHLNLYKCIFDEKFNETDGVVPNECSYEAKEISLPKIKFSNEKLIHLIHELYHL
ncbi:hypothetical protein TRFO_16750 [Tritrichomonas foetus]|uniref:Right handed beta helix domain-containing protein n=1 Tax=Tritrichomonas foetus TaxID=1144522 RepID=A0A1J4KPM8_9EUKA|nr:hypothetical protein TRFO_16750 [Tritrichomonas foetus]|eukprot:OHT13195.1 hypothetical protein TRFO_16750 [Tritrichomonas foetus]